MVMVTVMMMMMMADGDGVEAREVVGDEEVDGGYLESRQRTSNNFYPSFLFNSASKLDPVENKVINFVVPLAGRFKTFERFINNYEQVCLITNAKTELLVILYPHKLEDSIDNRNNLFSRAKALDQAVKHLNNNDLLFFIDVDIVFTHEALHRVRSNTIINRKIYFPIVFSQYDPNYVNYHSANRNSDKFSENNNYSENIFIINEVTGYWRQFGFGIVSLYKRDYLKTGGFNLSIEGWGKEDVDFYEKSVKSDLIVFRAPDINLIHVYHKVTCDEKLSNIQMSMCKGSRYETLASADTLTKIICNNSDYLTFASNRINKLKPGN
ncbi:chondroitin sulfate synthase 1-like [Microplitis mediator]|uniref:chondroitin sulfate synthase 1-like n=1 Tax=Microplitis mediator TaxID=375433 RepID=UPI002555CF42|nr:chondroitin sulfate synthase 1-like [Microplitis mediator]